MLIVALTIEERKNRDAQIESFLAQIASGDREGLQRLCGCIQTDVYAYALSKTGNKQDADDVAQDTFLQIFKYAKQYKPQGKPLAWIFTIELNLIRRLYQLRKRTVNFEEKLQNTDSGIDVETQVVNNQFLQAILRLLQEEEREVVALHIVSGLKHREIAKLLGKPLSTVLSKYNRAIKKIQNIVKEER
jgi:RNA polymerase sigma-70 factor (ECF subfamily)